MKQKCLNITTYNCKVVGNNKQFGGVMVSRNVLHSVTTANSYPCDLGSNKTLIYGP